VASRADHRSRYAQAGPGWYGRSDQPQGRRGFFGRLFGAVPMTTDLRATTDHPRRGDIDA
jgi:hypothetical protein